MDHFNMKALLLTAVLLLIERIEAQYTLKAQNNFPLHHLVKKSSMLKLAVKKKLITRLTSSITDLSVKMS
tara:strand:- start:250 stop:459 length:210 start_codon:yes stop_codon:yes gene_type:complete